MNHQIINRLDLFRRFIGQPIFITSGFRCKVWNLEKGGATRSTHMFGLGVDWYVKDDQWEVADLVAEGHFFRSGGVKIYRDKKTGLIRFHTDCRDCYGWKPWFEDERS